MTKLQKLQVEQSEKRQRLNELLGKEELTAEERSEMETLTNRLTEIEPELRAAIVAEGEAEEQRAAQFQEGSELRGLIEASNIGDILAASVEHRATDGQVAELQQELGLQPNQVPLALLRDPETRAVTPAPATVGANEQTVIPGVFPMSVAAWLGVDMPTVPSGDAVFPVLATNADVKTPAKNANAAETTGSFTAPSLSPSRLQASFFWAREDAARFAQLNTSLRQNLSEALADSLDKQILVGPNGLLTGTNLSDNDASAVADYAHYRNALGFGRVDGWFAANVGELKIVMGSSVYGHCSGIFGNNGDRAALEDLQSATAGVRVSAHVPAAANNKQKTLVRLGMRRDAVAPVWEGVTLIPDEVTKAKAGQICLTAVMLYAAKILRADGFHKQEIQIA